MCLDILVKVEKEDFLKLKNGVERLKMCLDMHFT